MADTFSPKVKCMKNGPALDFDWFNFPQQLQLLRELRAPRTFEQLRDLAEWNALLGEPLEQALERFKFYGLLKAARLENIIAHRFSRDEMRAMCIEHGLKRSGSGPTLSE